MHDTPRYVVGVDFGTLSGRAVVVCVEDGRELATAVTEYKHAVLDRSLPNGDRLPPDWALQVPEDYRDVLRDAVPTAVAAAGVEAADVIGVATDFTACTMIPVLDNGTPLCEIPTYEDRPHAYVKLWRHHAAQHQADRINRVAAHTGEPWLPRYGGSISSEWEFAKALQIFEEDRALYDAMDRWVEAADWIVWQLTGTYRRNTCTAGYKGMLQDGVYPTSEFLERLAPGFGTFVDDKLSHDLAPLGSRVGSLTDQAAGWTGLPAGIAVAAGNVDAHVTAPAAQAVEPGQMVAIVGTSTCHVMSSPELREVPGMCGVVDGGIVDGLYGYEAGQSGVGDIFAWFANTSVPPGYTHEASVAGVSLHEYLTMLAARQEVGEHGLLTLDWHSGNRSVLVDHELSGLVIALTLASRPEDQYRSLLEATAMGTRVIVEAFRVAGVPVQELIVAGGLVKNRLLMQIYADVLRLPLSVIRSEQGPALGSAIHAAVAAGAYPHVTAASAVMGGRRVAAFEPDPRRADVYDEMFSDYLALHDHFGRSPGMMRRLRGRRRRALERAVSDPTSYPGEGQRT